MVLIFSWLRQSLVNERNDDDELIVNE